ncbi:hypothetical protein AJ79_04369 [Helicocarpus griseus UAMH5409]|uniref:Uncharacterized protein n=1 Tax=Helicocarpus griseus UAMH5409 TaxID=1447875 RepID=A0A2B7XU58_9EURO|nr:hypothetical protein AJ79_04369 [Helicocarpus griseus UAMH5409]
MGQPLFSKTSKSLITSAVFNLEDLTTEPPRRLERRKILVQLETVVESLQAHKIDAAKLKELKIRVEGMVLDENSDSKPHFFTPHPSLPRPADGLNQPAVLHLQLDICVGDYKPYRSLYQYDQPEFGTFRMTDVPGGGFPHTMAVMYNDLETNDREVLRGELLTILRLMLGQYKKRRFIPHMTVPVLLFSLMGKGGRIIEAYCDDQQLILRFTALYHFREQTITAFKDFAEWYLGNPTGDTS